MYHKARFRQREINVCARICSEEANFYHEAILGCQVKPVKFGDVILLAFLVSDHNVCCNHTQNLLESLGDVAL
ncbi:hypothetical protein QVD17_10737 [Tagetes erecta]|uniref:Uncharacterized protein n=1 Tax=Tagetes erecta TaxID=13708 RepID=A0AAD8L1V3_TARER|nr:hypothetical protein QVD17_10737 [Tagetes erecta]